MKKQNHSADYNRLYAFASTWVKKQMRPFTSEDLKQAFHDADNDPVANVNNYGNVFVALAKEKVILKNDTSTAKMAKARGRLLNVWISIEYSTSQANKRLLPKSEQYSILS